MSTAVPRKYIPADEPLLNKRKALVHNNSTGMQQYSQHIKDHGPLPPNYTIIISRQCNQPGPDKGRELSYFHEESVKAGRHVGSWNHPCSPAESSLLPTFRPEPIDDREDITGVFHPPLPAYKAGRFVWKHHDSWESAIAASLHTSGVRIAKGNAITKEKVVQMDKSLEKKAVNDTQLRLGDTLYHPSDRGTAIFQSEPNAARAAKYQGRSLVVLCPLTPASGVGWNRFWHRSNRPPIRWRWSVGEQACNKFMVVGCIPKYVDNGVSKEAHWFTLEPTTAIKGTWDAYMKPRDFSKLKQAVQFRSSLSDEKFIWTLVAAHRTWTNNRLHRDIKLGDWIHQYGEYIYQYTKGDVTERTGFKADKKSKYNGRKIGSTELGAWILNSRESLKYVELWEKANEAHVSYWSKKSNEAWETFRERQHAASKLPE